MRAASGRPLRALALLVIATAIWFAARVPRLEGRYTAAMLAVRPPTPEGMAAAVRTLVHEGLGMGPPLAAPVPAVAAPAPTTAADATLADRHARTTTGSVDANLPAAALSVVSPPAPAHKVASPPAAPAGFASATQAYASLAIGDRRSADRLFGDALATAGDAPQAADWARARRRLNRHWSGDAYTLFRDAGTGGIGGGAAASPVLGGGKSGASLAYTIDPLAARPVAIIARSYAAHDDRNLIDGDTAQAAIGLRWQPAAGVSIAAERLIAIGAATSNDWNIRIAAGGERHTGLLSLAGYGEAGVRGNGAVYAGGQARAAVHVGAVAGMIVSAGPRAWGSVQSGFSTVSRVDVGIGMTAREAAGVAISADRRWRVAGHAAPVSGPAVTVAFGF